MSTCTSSNISFADLTISSQMECAFSRAGENAPAIWKPMFTAIVLICMFAAFRTDRFGPDSILMGTVALLLFGGIINTRESVDGFANHGLLAIMLLTIISEGISRTGAMEWYLGKILNRPKTAEWAQLRLMLPICLASGFFSNTTIVAASIPIVQRWSQKCGISPGKLMMPLSFAASLGGTLTLFGTSTNLIVYGLIGKYYPDEPAMKIEFFELTGYGVCLAMSGMLYVFLSSPYLLVPETQNMGGDILLHSANLLLGARVTPWSPAVGRTIKRSGLRDTGGIYLVSVKRETTGNVHYAVSVELVLGVGDVLYFTGLVEEFFDFCEEHGLEVVTNEDNDPNTKNDLIDFTDNNLMVGATKESLLEANEGQRFQVINRISDIIRGVAPQDGQVDYRPLPSNLSQIIATMDHTAVIVCIDTADRAALLLDIARELHSLNLELHHTEAAVVNGRSLSIWRCEPENIDATDMGEIWTKLHQTISTDAAMTVPKKRGLRVVRARVIRGSKLINKMPSKVRFRETFKAGIVTIQNRSRRKTSISESLFEEGDILVLQPSKDSPLMQRPPTDFYTYLRPKKGQSTLSSRAQKNSASKEAGRGELDAIWRDLQVILNDEDDPKNEPTQEFLTALEVGSNSNLIGQTASAGKIDELSNISLIGIERPTTLIADEDATLDESFEGSWNDIEPTEVQNESASNGQPIEIRVSEPLRVGDILWFSGPSSAITELRKIPGLNSYQSEDVKKMNEQAQKRRLVQAVVALHGPLIGKSVKEVRFRTRFGAAVIAVHRDGDRVHAHPGQIVLQAGDALLLEAGPTFEVRRPEYDRSFALVAEVNKNVQVNNKLMMPAIAIVAVMIILISTNVLEPYASALFACFLMVYFRILSEQEIRELLKWDLYVTSAASVAIGTALLNSGLADMVASILAIVCRLFGLLHVGVVGEVYILTFLLGNVVTNNAAAPMIFPIAMKAAVLLDLNRKDICYTIMLAASFNSITPYGCQTNLLVYGPGGYKYKDYVTFGGPLQLVLFLMIPIIIPLL